MRCRYVLTNAIIQNFYSYCSGNGNYDKVNCLGDFLARGGFKFDPAIRDWAALVQELYRGGITIDEFCKRNQKLTLETHWQGILDQLGITAEDLDHPEKQPPGYLGGSQM